MGTGAPIAVRLPFINLDLPINLLSEGFASATPS